MILNFQTQWPPLRHYFHGMYDALESTILIHELTNLLDQTQLLRALSFSTNVNPQRREEPATTRGFHRVLSDQTFVSTPHRALWIVGIFADHLPRPILKYGGCYESHVTQNGLLDCPLSVWHLESALTCISAPLVPELADRSSTRTAVKATCRYDSFDAGCLVFFAFGQQLLEVRSTETSVLPY